MRHYLTIENEAVPVGCYKCGTALVFSKYDNLAESICAECSTPLFLPHEVDGIRSSRLNPNIFVEKASNWFVWRVRLTERASIFKQFVRKLIQRTANTKGSKRNMSNSEFNIRKGQSNLDLIHDNIRSKLDELYSDLKELGADLEEGRREASQARKDRIQGIKRALRDLLEKTHRIEGLRLSAQDLLEAAEKADREWR